MTDGLIPLRVSTPLQKRLQKKTTEAQAAIARCIHRLRTGDFHRTGQKPKGMKKIKGRSGPDGQPVFEARASRGDRVTFYWDDQVIVIENHCDHSIL